MKKESFRGICFLIIVVIVFCTLNYRYKHSAYYRQIGGLFRYENIPNNLEIVNLGSSEEAMGIEWEIVPRLRGFNFASHGQWINADRLVLESYKEHLGTGCVVVIPASYFTPYYDRDITSNPGLYYRILSVDKIPECKIENLILYRYFPILSSGKELWETFNSLKYGKLEHSESGEVTLDEEILLEASIKKGTEYATYRLKPEVDSVCDAAYHMILEMCRENGWKAVIVTCPLHKSYDECYSDDSKERFYSYINSLCVEYPEVIYLDYSKEEIFYESWEHRYDGDHLDQSGRELFTKMLYNELREKGIL